MNIFDEKTEYRDPATLNDIEKLAHKHVLELKRLFDTLGHTDLIKGIDMIDGLLRLKRDQQDDVKKASGLH